MGIIVAALWILGGIVFIVSIFEIIGGIGSLLEMILVPILKVLGIPLLILFLLGLSTWIFGGFSSL